MSYADFANVFAVLALQLRATDADEAMVRAYYDVLKNFTLESVQRSAQALARETDRRFFPTTAEWATAAGEARTSALRQHLLTSREEPWQVECELCEDTGWRLSTCDGDDYCGRRHPHQPHGLARICPCRPTNRTYQRHHTFGRTASQ